MKSRTQFIPGERSKSEARLSLVNPGSGAGTAGMDRLGAIRLLLDQGRATAAQQQINQILRASRSGAIYSPLIAQARSYLAISLEMQGRYRESLEAVAMYEPVEARSRLDSDSLAAIRVQLGLAYNYLGDHPKAVAILNTSLREARESESILAAGNSLIALSRVYRSINEYKIARDLTDQALDCFRQMGDWRGMAESYFALSLSNVFEGQWEAGLENLQQARNLIGDRSATYLLGKIHTNMAGACWFLKRPAEGIAYLEKAVDYYENTEHKTNAMDGYNNLGETLLLVGEWDRAERALTRALELADEADQRPAAVAAVLDSLGKLEMLKGNLIAASDLLMQAVSKASEHQNKWYEGQALRTLCQCQLLNHQSQEAFETARQALALGEKIGDRQAICESRLLLAETHLQNADLDNCSAELEMVADETSHDPNDLAIAGVTHRLRGMLALARGEAISAIQWFSRSVTVYEMLGDVFRSARSHFFLGKAYSLTQPDRARGHLQRALDSFEKLGARLAAEEAGRAISEQSPVAVIPQEEIALLLRLLTLRLSEASTSRELLLRELFSILRDETGARKILVAEPSGGEHSWEMRLVASFGWDDQSAKELLHQFSSGGTASGETNWADEHDITVLKLNPARAKEVTLFVSPGGSHQLSGGLSIDSLLRVAELGLNSATSSETSDGKLEGLRPLEVAEPGLLPGFIHSSPAMSRLIEEIHKIRSSDVTALVTGESGTGKELVARAIHSLSTRRSKVFVPFNCTAVPRELSDAFLFGYRRGAFTGAVADSPGVIRAAEGGTLFLDEVGDLPIEIQPKLLRFLQEGEIQPLGEQRPTRVNVRVIAATNSDLEEMVAAGRFREDLYYRLNVIRLHVAPLRERRSEIATLANYYAEHYSSKFGKRELRIGSQAMDLMTVYDWPGNVRQLTNEIQRIVARGEDRMVISPEHLSPEIRRNGAELPVAAQAGVDLKRRATDERLTMVEAVDRFKRELIIEALRRNSGNVTRTAKELGMTRRGLQLMIVRYDVRY